MTIGINAAAALKQPRTGVEEYTYQLIKHLTMLPEARQHRFLLYIPSAKCNANLRMHANATNGKNPPQPSLKGGSKNSSPPLGGRKAPWGPRPFTGVRPFGSESLRLDEGDFDFELPSNFEIKTLRWPLPFLWTQIRLAWKLWRRKPDALFVPAHILPFGAPSNSTVVIHGLEYEYFPEYYPLWRRLYLRWSTKRAARRAKKIIAVSESTKKDLVKFYGVEAEKISVVYHGVFSCHSDPAGAGEESRPNGRSGIRQRSLAVLGMTAVEKPYILYLGRIETKKNVQGILAAYKILKEECGVPHQLVLAGSPGYGYDNLKLDIRHLLEIRNSDLEIKELGYVSEVTKRQLLSEASIFLFPSFYEGFGLPVLEAQAAGVPVVTSANSCLPEVAGEGALFVNPRNPAQIAEAVKLIIDDNDLRDRLIQSGLENVKRFNWEKCAKKTLEIIIK